MVDQESRFVRICICNDAGLRRVCNERVNIVRNNANTLAAFQTEYQKTSSTPKMLFNHMARARGLPCRTWQPKCNPTIHLFIASDATKPHLICSSGSQHFLCKLASVLQSEAMASKSNQCHFSGQTSLISGPHSKPLLWTRLQRTAKTDLELPQAASSSSWKLGGSGS